ncbi:TPA: type IV toxin-antitoxin system AbiEi family antitoxin domain-containing protein [Candidatus Ventrenecus avicola]|nr:type IV toxin-antitoxin system AbiEi family antitoxin domain-containing protein [Candidatus Ventrenecus avicola]
MRKVSKVQYKIDGDVLKNYVEAINSIKAPMSQIKEQLNQLSESKEELNKALNESMKLVIEESGATFRAYNPMMDQLKKIHTMANQMKELIIKYPNDHAKIYIDIMKQIMSANNGMLSVRMIEPLNISRQYLSIMENNNDIEKISRGIYLSPSTFEDSYFSFQQKYKKAIFSHMNALYFYGMTEEFPYQYTVTVPQSYHVDTVNEKCNVFYVSDDIYEMGVVEVETPSGNKVRAYDKERCICDIIRSKGRLDPEQVKKAMKQYIQSKDKNVVKLSDYAKRMGIIEKVMEMVSVYYE